MSDFQTLPTRLNVLSTSVCTFQHAVFCFGCSGSEDSAECTAICQGASASSWNLVLPCQTFWGWLVIVNVPLDGIIKVMCLALPRWEPKGTFNLTRHSILITCRFPIFVFFIYVYIFKTLKVHTGSGMLGDIHSPGTQNQTDLLILSHVYIAAWFSFKWLKKGKVV